MKNLLITVACYSIAITVALTQRAIPMLVLTARFLWELLTVSEQRPPLPAPIPLPVAALPSVEPELAPKKATVKRTRKTSSTTKSSTAVKRTASKRATKDKITQVRDAESLAVDSTGDITAAA